MKPHIRRLHSWILLFALATLFGQCSLVKRNEPRGSSDFDMSYLELYGKSVFEQEKCISCHTLDVSLETDQLLSLDGVGGKYSAPWLYTYLIEPSSIIGNSKKKSYWHLAKQGFDQKRLRSLSKNSSSKISTKLVNALIKEECQVIINNLKEFDIVSNHTEILALIAYLNQIPSSPNKRSLDSTKAAYYREQSRIVDSLAQTQYFSEIEDIEETLERGKMIFSHNCIACHGQNAEGIVGPNLTDNYFLHGDTRKDIIKVIMDGVASKGMIPWKHSLSARDIKSVAAYVHSLKNTNQKGGKAPQGELGE